MYCPKGWGSMSLTLFSFLSRRTLSSWELPLGAELCQPGEWDYAGKMKLFFPFRFCAVILRFFFSTVLLKPIKWTHELFQSCFCSWVAV